MIRFYDFRCQECGTTGEVLLNHPAEFIPCSCGGMAVRVWLCAPGIKNKAKGLYPYHDTQLGITVESPQHRERIAKERGLLILGTDEYNRMRNSSPETKADPMVDSRGWRDAAEKAYADIKKGEVPPEVKISTIDDVECDVLTSDRGI